VADQFPAPTKKVLSPAAQAVLDAAGASEPGIYATIAAALRAAADQVEPTEKDRKEQSDITGQVFLNGMQYAVMEILAIAAELEPT
jgi:hypothetical protein